MVLFDEYASRYPYAADGRIPAGGESGPLEPFTALSFLAANTRRIRLGTGICLVPQRNPVYTAKEVAAVDWLSGGRFDFGVGVGWLAEEFRACGVPFERRGARCRDYLAAMQRPPAWVRGGTGSTSGRTTRRHSSRSSREFSRRAGARARTCR